MNETLTPCFTCDRTPGEWPDTDPFPPAGSLCLCPYCGGLSVYTGDRLTKREATIRELFESFHNPVVAEIRSALAQGRPS